MPPTTTTTKHIRPNDKSNPCLNRAQQQQQQLNNNADLGGTSFACVPCMTYGNTQKE
jgi:hypothetical protein